MVIVEAELDRNVDTFKKQDPYAIFEMTDWKFKTKTINNGGKTPKWDETTENYIQDTGDEMSVAVWDEDTLDDDLICEGKIALAQICVEGGSDSWHELSFEGKTVGKIHLVT